MQSAFSASHSSPKIFPFFENRAYTTWKNHMCVCVCVWKSVVTSKQPQNMDTISGVVSFPLDGRHEAGIRRADQATSGARAIRILKTCRSSYVFGIEDSGNAIVSGRFARNVPRIVTRNLPLRKLDPKLFLLSGFKPPRQIFYLLFLSYYIFFINLWGIMIDFRDDDYATLLRLSSNSSIE